MSFGGDSDISIFYAAEDDYYSEIQIKDQVHLVDNFPLR